MFPSFTRKKGLAFFVGTLSLATLFHAPLHSQGVDFTFLQDSEGWISGDPVAPFDAPSHGHKDGAIFLQSENNTNTFGYWDSPLVVIPADEATEGGMRLYCSYWTMYTDVEESADVPQFRTRAFRPDHSFSSVQTVESIGPADYTTDQFGRVFDQYFEQADGNNEMYFAFDLLNFNPLDDPAGLVSLGYVHISERYPPDPGEGILLGEYDFTTGDTHGFTPRLAPPLLAPHFDNSNEGLMISGTDAILTSERGEPSTPVFGYWGMETEIEFEANRLYQICFNVGSDAEPANAINTPVVRCRVNDSTLQGSWYLNIDSTGESPRVPDENTDQMYMLWVITQPRMIGKKMIFSFDYLRTPADGNSPLITMMLRGLSITAYPYFD